MEIDFEIIGQIQEITGSISGGYSVAIESRHYGRTEVAINEDLFAKLRCGEEVRITLDRIKKD